MMESSVKSFKEGRKHGFHPSLRKFSSKSPFSLLSYIGAYLESWVKFLDFHFSTSQTLRTLWDLK